MVCLMIYCRELYLLTQRQEQWDFVCEKYVACEEDFLVKIYQSYRDLNLIPGHVCCMDSTPHAPESAIPAVDGGFL